MYVCLALEHVEHVAPVFAVAADAARTGATLVVHELHAEYRSALVGAGWDVATISEWRATEEAIARQGKLAKHRGRPVLIEVVARRRG